MKKFNLIEACSIVGDALASRMELASKRETMSILMPLLKDCLTLLTARFPCLRIMRVTFYTMSVIPEHKIRRIHSRKSHSGPNHAFMYKGETSSSRQSTSAKLPKKKTPIA
jgi:hypothetical protein